MVTFQDVRNADPEAVREFAQSWDRVVRQFTAAFGQLDAQVTAPLGEGTLRSRTLSAAKSRAASLGTHIDAGVREGDRVRGILGEHADRVDELRQRLRDLERDIDAHPGMSLAPDGSVTFSSPLDPLAVGPQRYEDSVREGEANARRFAAVITTVLADATAHDGEVVARLTSAAELDEGIFGPDVSFNGDPRSEAEAALGMSGIPAEAASNPQVAADWWRGLPPSVREWYLDNHFREIGGMNGIPAVDRHEANIAWLRIDAEQGVDTTNARRLLERIDESRMDGNDFDDIYLIGYQPPAPSNGMPGLGSFSGTPDAHVIAAIGNPDTASTTGVYVPGTGTDLGSAAGGDLDRTMALHEATSRVSNNPAGTSTILWLGYDAPDTIPSALSDDYAVDAGPQFDRFVNGLHTTNDVSGARVTAMGHSYGSTVVGQADVQGDGLAVDDMILVGSPGLGEEANGPVDVDGVEDLHMDPQRVWALDADGVWVDNPFVMKVADHPVISSLGLNGEDPATDMEWHGDDPADADFGARRLKDDTFGHSGYWTPGSQSLEGQARVIAFGEPGAQFEKAPK